MRYMFMVITGDTYIGEQSEEAGAPIFDVEETIDEAFDCIKKFNSEITREEVKNYFVNVSSKYVYGSRYVRIQQYRTA